MLTDFVCSLVSRPKLQKVHTPHLRVLHWLACAVTWPGGLREVTTLHPSRACHCTCRASAGLGGGLAQSP